MVPAESDEPKTKKKRAFSVASSTPATEDTVPMSNKSKSTDGEVPSDQSQVKAKTNSKPKGAEASNKCLFPNFILLICVLMKGWLPFFTGNSSRSIREHI